MHLMRYIFTTTNGIATNVNKPNHGLNRYLLKKRKIIKKYKHNHNRVNKYFYKGEFNPLNRRD